MCHSIEMCRVSDDVSEDLQEYQKVLLGPATLGLHLPTPRVHLVVPGFLAQESPRMSHSKLQIEYFGTEEFRGEVPMVPIQ